MVVVVVVRVVVIVVVLVLVVKSGLQVESKVVVELLEVVDVEV